MRLKQNAGKSAEVKPVLTLAHIPGKEEAYGPYQVSARTYRRHDRAA